MRSSNKFKIAIVQGRLSSPVGSRYQHFPIHSWRQEFSIAADLGFDGIEWIVSDFSNPIFDSKTIQEVYRLSRTTKVRITSIGLDVLMYQPIFRLPWDDIAWIFRRLTGASERLGVRRINIPIEENSGIRTQSDRRSIAKALRQVLKRFGKSLPLISLETDLSPENAAEFLSLSGLQRLGLLVDLGNISANGFRIDDFIGLCADRIYGIHVKDRTRIYGVSCPLGSGDAELRRALARVAELPNLVDITLQSYRTPGDYLKNARTALAYVHRLLRG